MSNLPTHHCLRCGHGTPDKPWYPRKPDRPGVCSKCKSPLWDQPRIRQASKTTSEFICPWCHATIPVASERKGSLFIAHERAFEAYRCACGAVGSPSGDIGEAAWPLDDVEAALAGLLKVPRGHMETTINHVTHTNPSMLMLWGRKRMR